MAAPALAADPATASVAVTPGHGWGSQFQGREFETSCRDAPNVTIQAGVAHICRPVFRRR